MRKLFAVISVLASFFWVSVNPCFAGVIYQFTTAGEFCCFVAGTLEIAAPPASATSGWSTVDKSDLIGLFLGIFGSSDLNSFEIVSENGSRLDGGGIGSSKHVPGDPTIDYILEIGFAEPEGADAIELATVFRYSDGRVVIGDLFVDGGDWVVLPQQIPVIPEPSTFALLGIGVGLLGIRGMINGSRCKLGSGSTCDVTG